jgi:hypothetical protein
MKYIIPIEPLAGGQIGRDPLVQLIIGVFEDDGRMLFIGVGQGGTFHPGGAQLIAFANFPVNTEHQSRRLLRALHWPKSMAPRCDQ